MINFKELVVFGDSLSDNGNLYLFLNSLIPKSPPYFEGHFSNGPTWIEYLYAIYNTTWDPTIKPYYHPNNFRNFAVGGAGALITSKEELPYSLDMEVELYKFQHYFTDKSNTLYSILIGANNYIKAPTNVEEITTNVISAINTSIKKLIGAGASQFLILNLPDLGKTPEAIANNTSQLLTQLSYMHNDKLSSMINELTVLYPRYKFMYIDLMSIFLDIYNNPANYEITDISIPANNSGMIVNPIDNISINSMLDYLDQAVIQKALRISTVVKNEMVANPVLNNSLVSDVYSVISNATAVPDSPTAEGYLFWDGVHPTTKVHKIVAEKIKQSLDNFNITYIQD